MSAGPFGRGSHGQYSAMIAMASVNVRMSSATAFSSSRTDDAAATFRAS